MVKQCVRNYAYTELNEMENLILDNEIIKNNYERY